MRYTNDYVDNVQDYLKWFEKELNISLGKLTTIEYKLADIFKDGYELGQSERSESDYDEGYDQGKMDTKDEDDD